RGHIRVTANLVGDRRAGLPSKVGSGSRLRRPTRLHTLTSSRILFRLQRAQYPRRRARAWAASHSPREVPPFAFPAQVEAQVEAQVDASPPEVSIPPAQRRAVPACPQALGSALSASAGAPSVVACPI